MSILRDWRNNHKGDALRYKVEQFLTPSVWVRLHKKRTQRADRGWADEDAWGMGEYVARITVEMLELLRDKGVVDRDKWFEYNIGEKNTYKNLQEVIDDIKDYQEWLGTSWADGLEIIDGKTDKYPLIWVDKKGEKLTEAAIKSRINKHGKDGKRKYKKATKAMAFFGRHFAQFWD